MSDVGGIMRDAEDNLGGDYVLAALVRHAHGFAITIKRLHPSMTAEETRREWDLQWARNARADVDAVLWREVEQLSREIASRQ